MLARAGGYYRADFKEFWGVMQVDPMSPTIVNVEVDRVVQQWASFMEERTLGQDGSGREGRHCGAFFTWMMAW